MRIMGDTRSSSLAMVSPALETSPIMHHRRIAAVLFAALFLGFAASPAFAQSGKTILIRNVLLIDQDSSAEPRTISILIKDSILDLITEDLVSLEAAHVSYDAAGGVVLGQLNLGEPAAFMILSGDPRTNTEILLDTKRYATFAISGGRILKNSFAAITQETPEEKKRAAKGWLAYAPPPLAIPLNYRDASRWNRFDGNYVSGIFVAALLLDRQRWTDQDSASRNQVGDLSQSEGGEIRALRLGGVGTINLEKPWVWTLFGATHAFDQGFGEDSSDELTILDARLDIPLWDNFNLSIGKQKEPISMERLMSLVDLPMQERAAVSDALLPSRNVGLIVSGNLVDDRVALAGGVFNDWIDDDQPSSISNNSTQYVGRATFVPYTSSNESTLLHVGVGLRYSNAKEGGTLRVEPEFKQSPLFAESALLSGDSFSTYQAEASLRSGPLWLHTEYVSSRLDTPGSGDVSVEGYHLTASWILTGEVRPYNKRVGVFGSIPIARSVKQHGKGAWELAARFSHLDLSDAPGSSGGDAGQLDIWSAGINWRLSPFFHISFNHRYITLDRNDEEGTSQGLNIRVTLILE